MQIPLLLRKKPEEADGTDAHPFFRLSFRAFASFSLRLCVPAYASSILFRSSEILLRSST